MEPLHARYPFLSAAREAVEAADVGLDEVVAENERVVERALERVRSAIQAGSVGDPHRSDRIELLSYPVARVLVSLVDEPGLVRRYARAEADVAVERIRADIGADEGLRSVDAPRLDLGTVLAEFDLADSIERRPDESRRDAGFAVDVAAYLRLAADLEGRRWRLVERAPADGRVPVSREELFELLGVAIRERVEAGLPLDVPEPVADALEGRVETLRAALADLDPARDIDAVEPDLFPPCVRALEARAEAGDSLPAHSRFALVSFLAAIGADDGAIVDRFAGHPGIDAEGVRSQVAHLRDAEGGEYPPPSCATMAAYGDCVNTDALCDRIAHPLDYYRRRLDGDDAVLDQASRPESQ